MKQNERRVETISGQVYRIIRDDICSGTYPPGYWLQENELAKRLSISRSLVREALRRLVADHLVVEIPNKGIFVRDFSLRDIQEVFDVRVMLESYALDHIHENLTERRREKLLTALVNLRDAYSDNNLELYIEHDTKLHNLIIHQADNTLVESINDQVAFLIQRFRRFSLKGKDRFDASIIEHEQIVNAIINNNPEEAKRVNCRHLELARDKILEYLDSIANERNPAEPDDGKSEK
ncbi:MAG: GntR family transcriptional regulator [Clostridia bacterium]|nr:GntR family transcriptional regulator [Clostridia bacterium]